MNEGEWFYKKLWFRLYIFPLLAASFFYDKWLEGLKGVALFVFNFGKYVLFLLLFHERVMPVAEIFSPLNSSVVFIIGWVLVYWMLYRASLFVIAQFILPVNKWEDRKKAAQRIRLFARGKHGAAIFVRNGNIIARQAEMDSKKPGVALVDLNSAIVLARHDNAKSWSLPDEDEIAAPPPPKMEFRLPWKKRKPAPAFYDAKGPGVVFIEQGQKIDGVVNLRKQTRTSGEVVVYTRNGIKVKSKVSVVFSLSDEPEVFTVGYVDGTNIHHLKILKTKETGNDLVIEGVYDLDAEDATDILDVVKKPPVANSASAFVSGPYKFNRERVLSAALSQARNKNGDAILWHEAPLEIATDIFRSVLAQIPYDNLFSGGDLYNRYNLSPTSTNERGAALVLARVKDDFLIKVKVRGLAAFQFVQLTSGAYFSQEKINQKQPIPLEQVQKYSPVILTNERFNYLRSRGIVIKNASFGELQAVESEIQDRMAQNWLAKMENEIAVSSAGYELEAIRVHNRSRALLQEEMTHLLSGVFQPATYSDEALALRVLQALETMVAEMSYEDMQYTDMYELLRNVHDWILAEEAPPALPPSDMQPVE